MQIEYYVQSSTVDKSLLLFGNIPEAAGVTVNPESLLPVRRNPVAAGFTTLNQIQG